MSQQYSAYSILAKKRDNVALAPEEIKWFIDGLARGDVADYQMSAFLMAITINGATAEETAALTDAMLYSGKVVQFEGAHYVDKHS
ncbi:MAG: pyrimidine-nucleoside phosphorylase, partial [Halobacteriovoraceae bacterium]|nr:pyrimidine-nucleoside phosphorylase [Halobacteriovoraceae bacterium]